MNNNKYSRKERIRFYTELLDNGKCEDYIQYKLRKLETYQDWTERVSSQIKNKQTTKKLAR